MQIVLDLVRWLSSNYKIKGNEVSVAEYSLGGKSSSLRISQDTRIDVSKCRDKNILAELVLSQFSLYDSGSMVQTISIMKADSGLFVV